MSGINENNGSPLLENSRSKGFGLDLSLKHSRDNSNFDINIGKSGDLQKGEGNLSSSNEDSLKIDDF